MSDTPLPAETRGFSAVPGSKKPDPICTISGLKRSFGGVTAADIEHLEIQRGLITAVIGPNGAGKTTLFNLLTAFENPDAGQWQLNGELLTRQPAHKIAKAGMIRTFQLTKTLDHLSVLDNMLLASQRQKGERLINALLPMWRDQEKTDTAKARHILENFGLSEMLAEQALTLSGGQRKLLEISRALMSDPDFILLDEPLAGVNPALIDDILEHIRNLKKSGVTIALIEHNIDAVLEVSDWVVCLAEGSVIAECEPQDLINNQKVVDAYLGR